MSDIAEIHDQNVGKSREEIQDTKLGFFMTAGSALLHEMMHTYAITHYDGD